MQLFFPFLTPASLVEVGSPWARGLQLQLHPKAEEHPQAYQPATQPRPPSAQPPTITPVTQWSTGATVVLLLGKQIDEFSKKSWYAKFTTTQLGLTEGDVTLDDSQRPFLAQHRVARRCNILATLFGMVTTLYQYCSAVLVFAVPRW